jgi:chaperonin GroEL
MAVHANAKTAGLGDGSKLAVILAHELLRGGVSALKAGLLPRDVVYGMDSAVERVLAVIEAQAKAMNDADLLNIAVTASAGDRLISNLVVEGLRKAGKDGLLYVEEWPGETVELELQEGMYFDRGFLSTEFITDPMSQEAVLENPRILICEQKITSMFSLLPFLEQSAKNNTPLLVVAEDRRDRSLRSC